MSTELIDSRSEHDFGSAGTGLSPQNTQAQMMISRQAQEVQAAMIVAKQYPRDENASFSRIMQACKRKRLADEAVYAYPRGKETVSGPSIRMAEVLAQNWGNIDFGIIELEQKNGESQVMAYCWDLETNTRQTKIFSQPHVRHTRNGSYPLTDPRDIYELVANNGARRLRACILGVIPGDVVDAAVQECEKTMSGGNTEPLADRVRKMVSAFSEMGVTIEQVEQRLGKKTEAVTEPELVNLRKIFKSIKDGMASPADFFSAQTVQASGSKSDGLADQLQQQLQDSTPAAKDQVPPPDLLALLKEKLAAAKTAGGVRVSRSRVDMLPPEHREEGERLYAEALARFEPQDGGAPKQGTLV